uniref:Uncharacterized protein n=1 Tax=Anguilla anguilla TaxID=7936 RepID=A0A0E9VVC1_ANGAN
MACREFEMGQGCSLLLCLAALHVERNVRILSRCLNSIQIHCFKGHRGHD